MAEYILPEELWQHHILSYLELPDLCKLRTVSKHYNWYVENYFQRMKSLDITEYKNILSPDGFYNIIRHLKQLEYISVKNCWQCATSDNMKLLFSRCSKSLRYVTLARCGSIEDDMIEELCTQCTNVVYLDISYCFKASEISLLLVTFRKKKLTDVAAWEISASLHQLEELLLCSNYGIKDDSLKAITKKCTKLVRLDIAGCLFTAVALEEYADDVVVGKSSLKEIRVTKCRNVCIALHRKRFYIRTLASKFRCPIGLWQNL